MLLSTCNRVEVLVVADAGVIPGASADPVSALSDRELEVLRLLRSDLSLREIAQELYISHNTIKSYTQSIYRKLGVTSRSAALETASDIDLI